MVARGSSRKHASRVELARRQFAWTIPGSLPAPFVILSAAKDLLHRRKQALRCALGDYGVAVAVSSAGGIVLTITLAVFGPATVPIFHFTLTSPSALVTALCGVIAPPPPTT